MPQSTMLERGTPRASLAAIGVMLQERQFFAPIHAHVHIAQKTVKYTPTEKLYDAFITILAGAHGLVEVNTRLRADPALQRAFGRTACAEQSVIQETLDACTEEHVTEMQAAFQMIYRAHSQGYAHDYARDWHLLDVDLSGVPCGRKAAFATKGYFAKQPNRRGRQLGRVLATRYQEVVVDQVFTGTTTLAAALQTLVTQAAQVLDVTDERRARTLIRVDAGGGSLADVNALLTAGYAVLAKDYSTRRSARVAQSVAHWYPDPKLPGREVGWVSDPPTAYARPVRRVAVRCRATPDDPWQYGVLIGPPELPAIWSILHGDAPLPTGEDTQILAYVHAYDARGGGVETSFKEDKQGLGITKRNKKRMAAQQVLTILGSLAHNVCIWVRGWVSSTQPRLRRYGLKRMVRDVFQVAGRLRWDASGHIVQISLNQAAPLAKALVQAFRFVLKDVPIVINLGEI